MSWEIVKPRKSIEGKNNKLQVGSNTIQNLSNKLN